MANIPSIIKENYYNGQLLQVSDFITEQSFHIQHRTFQTQQTFSAGILTGLDISYSANTITVTAGAAIDNNGQQILLTADKSYTLTETDGTYQLVLVDAMVAIQPNQYQSNPNLKLIPAGQALNEGFQLGNITVLNKSVTGLTNKATAVQILPARLPQQQVPKNLDASVINSGVFNANQIPDLQKLNGKLSAQQVPLLQEMGGLLTSTQVPQLQQLSGQLTTAQLPADIGQSKDYVTFFADQTVIGAGSSIQLSWVAAPGVDDIKLSFFSVKGIINIQASKDKISLQESGFLLTPIQNTVYTITAYKAGVTLAQKQLNITVVSLRDLVQLQFSNNIPAADCVTQIRSIFQGVTAENAAIALANAGYSFTDTGTAIMKGYTVAPADLGRILAKAFPAN